MMRTPILALLLIAALTAPALTAPGAASGNGNAGGGGHAAGAAAGAGNANAERPVTVVPKDNNVAHEAVKKHQILSLEAVSGLVGKNSSGRVLDVELVRLDGALAYEVTVLETDGRLHKLYYNAGSGTLMDDR